MRERERECVISGERERERTCDIRSERERASQRETSTLHFYLDSVRAVSFDKCVSVRERESERERERERESRLIRNETGSMWI